jgi:multiple sugar transport system ATP-binding protein
VAGFIGSPAMNFIPCKLEQAGSGLQVRLSDTIAFAVPGDRNERYKPYVGKDSLLFGLRPEHMTDGKTNGEANIGLFDANIEVTEPMGNETMVFFSISGVEVCGRVSPTAGAKEGHVLRMAAHLAHMHLIDDSNGKVL